MRIDKVNVRVVKEGASRELFVTGENPHMNFVVHADGDEHKDLESGQYSLELVPLAAPESDFVG